MTTDPHPHSSIARAHDPVALGALALAVLVAALSAIGLFAPGSWAHETPSWAAQGVGQDAFDLVVLVPILALSARGVTRRSRVALVVLGGALLFSAYTFVIYTFAVRFNAMFLGYCAALGASVYLGAAVARRLHDDVAPAYRPTASMRPLAGLLVLVALAFMMLWLGDVVPAIARGEVPVSVRENALPTNPVHVLDLALLLPAMIVVGRSLWRGRRLGLAFGPTLGVFTALMALSLAGLFVVLGVRHLPTSLSTAVAMLVLAGLAGSLAARTLRGLEAAAHG